MAALAVMTNRFSPPEIVLGVKAHLGRKLRTRISSESQFYNGGEVFAEQEALPSSELIWTCAVTPRKGYDASQTSDSSSKLCITQHS
ncbi:hypothetical protein KIN20_028598 [Parelaphostrongylus tenuis]|uniref:Uncharacterized protein n=1 Tax=Parelaphostrongylus tenuis TaxID=148309 RepID=A0AAD5R1C8_PARTN|nr:hypothetical protein KIN20_028598 [Parelaphostrongylus tenuis]